MKALESAGYVVEKRDGQSVSYILQQPEMLFTTGYKVLRNQQKAGFVSCIKTTFNGKDKLLYDVKGLRPLVLLAQDLEAVAFMQIIGNVLRTFSAIASIGFLFPANIEVDPGYIFVNPATNETGLIYLPIKDEYGSYMNGQYETALKQGLRELIQNNPNLQVPLVQPLEQALAEPGTSLEQLRTHAAVSTGNISTGGLQPPAQEEQPDDVQEAEKKKGFFTGLFSQKPKKEAELVPGIQGGETSVLEDVFAPTIVFVGVKTKEPVELVIDKAEYLLGKNSEAVDGALAFNGAISRVHCKIVCEDGQNQLIDLDSANGTFVNGTKLTPNTPVAIDVGDTIQLANSNFTIKPI